MRRAFIPVIVSAIVLTAGCSQVAALTPVGGDAITTVRNATYDVLFDQQIAVLVAPVCKPTESGFTCTGETVDGQPIVTTAAATKPFDMAISVGGTVIFEGNAQDVLNADVREAP